MTVRPWSAVVNGGDEFREFGTFAVAECWARKRAMEIALREPPSVVIEIDYHFVTVAHVKVDALDRVWTELVDRTGLPPEAREEIRLATSSPPELPCR